MDKKEEEFLKKLLSTFKVEAKEHISAITAGLINLEKATAQEQMGYIETIYREAHSLKGAARSVNLNDIESICQSMESVFAALKRKEIIISPALFDILHEALDCISKLLSTDGKTEVFEKSLIKELVLRLENLPKGAQPFSQQAVEPSEQKKEQVEAKPISINAPSIPDTVRIPIARLDSILLQAEELLSVKLATSQRAAELQEIGESFAAWEKEYAKVHPFDQNDASIKSLEHKIGNLTKAAEYDQRLLGGMVDNLLVDMKKVLMLPFSTLLEIFPKLVRDLSRDQGKDVELVIRGEEIEIDRRILEEMKVPLIHLLRNCIDHGIEMPDERQKKKKPSRGTLKLAIASKNGSHIEILVFDDGRGIDVAAVKTAAVKHDIISMEEAEILDEHEALSLIFRSGVSTNPIITDISGRGLGLSIVSEKVEKLNGTIYFETKPDSGTTFRIVIPLTLATFRGLMVQVNEYFFILPTTNIERVVRVKKEEIKTVENRETISLNGKAISLVRLEDVLQLPRKTTKSDSGDLVYVAVLGSAEKRVAFMMDSVLQEQEIMVKSLGKQLSRVRNIAGATVLGTGKVVPILNVNDLMKSAVKVTAQVKIPETSKLKAKRKSILVVDDSITSRTLLKNILDTAGYDIKTAVDGLDALTILKTQAFDLVVSDIDMPRMNGFDLTSKIRSNIKLSELPVIMVTGLDSREDKERGIEVGANAYIVKSSFDQSNLLDVVRRLI
ncbi:MAG: hybrid sensor histidine kinase/response regulator [Candidatus Methanoperedens sp.]